MKKLLSALLGLTLVPFAPTVAAAETLDWRLCRDIATGWSKDDTRSECATVAVPLNYAEPDGRQLNLAISRIRASGRRDGVVLFNPGGPGASGISMPRSMLSSKAAGLGEHHDLIGFAPRGVGYSGHVECPYDNTPADPALPEKERERFESDRDARALQRCVAADPEFARNLTTVNAARDLDRIRLALGERKIGYYGISWGTALGAQYRTMFDQNVDKMLLDSVMPHSWDLGEMDRSDITGRVSAFHEFAAWIARNDAVYHFGTTQSAVVTALLDLRARQKGRPDVYDSYISPARQDWPDSARWLVTVREGTQAEALGWDDRAGFSSFVQTAFMCNDATGSRDFETMWRTRQQLIADFPIFGQYASNDKRCVGWPFPAQPWQFTTGTSPLQLVGHTYERVTPLSWAHDMRLHIGGALLVVNDDVHGSLSDLPCASKAVEFFDTGNTSNDSCDGAPIPPAG